jgi:hypothetical protein
MTSSSYDDWPDIAGRLRRDLADGLDVAGVVEETDVLTRIGAISFEVVIDSSDLEGTDQASAYVVVLDLLATRMRQGAEQVLGCLLFSTTPDAEALVVGLVGMGSDTGVFAPIVPLGRVQAEALAAAGIALEELIDDATSLIGIAADRTPINATIAENLLAELDELIYRRT